MNNEDIIKLNSLKETSNVSINSAYDLSRKSNMIDEINRHQIEKEARQTNALEQTAKNTGETNNRLNIIIDNQNSYIALLKKQLDTINNIFVSNENSKEYEKELLELLKSELGDKHPLLDIISNIGVNVASDGITSAVPVLFNVFKKFLIGKGIIL